MGLRPFTGADMLQGKVFELVRRAVVGRLEQYLPRPVVDPPDVPGVCYLITPIGPVSRRPFTRRTFI